MPDIKNRMPNPQTLRKYYKDSPLTNDELMECAEFVRDQQGSQGISVLSFPMKVLVAWVEQQKGGKA